MKVLHPVLKHKWYDMIERYEKREEYRDFRKWGPRICAIRKKQPQMCGGFCDGCKYLVAGTQIPTNIGYICFHRGYTNTTMMWETVTNRICTGRTEWGAPKDERVLAFDLWRKVDPVTKEESPFDYRERNIDNFKNLL